MKDTQKDTPGEKEGTVSTARKPRKGKSSPEGEESKEVKKTGSAAGQKKQAVPEKNEESDISSVYTRFCESLTLLKNHLEFMLQRTSDGFVPTAEERNEFNVLSGILLEEYDTICGIAKAELTKEELPAAGSPASFYFTAVTEGLAARKQRLEEVVNLLKKFLSVQSASEALTGALAPYKQDVESLLMQLEQGSLRDLSVNSERVSGPACFLQAVSFDDLNTEEGNRLLDALETDYGFSRHVTRGLASRAFYVPEPVSGEERQTGLESVPARKEAKDTQEEPAKAEEETAGERKEEEENPKDSEEPEELFDAKEEENIWAGLGDTRFQHMLEECGFALPVEEFEDVLHCEVSPSETKKVTVSVFSGDLRKGFFPAYKIIIQDLLGYLPYTSVELFACHNNIPLEMAGNFIEYLFRKGYLRKYSVFSGGEIYCASPRLEKALTFKEACRLIDVKWDRQIPEDLAMLDDRSPTIVAVYVYMQMIIRTGGYYKNFRFLHPTYARKFVKESFFLATSDRNDQRHIELYVGAFWTGYDDCDFFMDALDEFVEGSESVELFVISAMTREGAQALAESIKILKYRQLEDIPWYLYAVKEEQYYLADTDQPIEIGQIWPNMKGKQKEEKKQDLAGTKQDADASAEEESGAKRKARTAKAGTGTDTKKAEPKKAGPNADASAADLDGSKRKAQARESAASGTKKREPKKSGQDEDTSAPDDEEGPKRKARTAKAGTDADTGKGEPKDADRAVSGSEAKESGTKRKARTAKTGAESDTKKGEPKEAGEAVNSPTAADELKKSRQGAEAAVSLENGEPDAAKADEGVNSSAADENALKGNAQTAEEKDSAVSSQEEMLSEAEEELSAADDTTLIVCRLIDAGKNYCAAAYAKAKSLKSVEYADLYVRLAFAFNDPMNRCEYSADVVFSLVSGEHTVFLDDLMVAAGLRTFFSNQVSYDHNLKGLYNLIKQYDAVDHYPSLSKVIYLLFDFKEVYKKGLDAYAEYHAKSTARLEEELSNVRQEAQLYYENTITGKKQEKAAQRRFVETKKALFNPSSEIGIFIKAVADDDRSSFPAVVSFLQENFLKKGSEPAEENLDDAMLWEYIQEFWDRAAQRRNLHAHEDLKGQLRSNVTSITTKGVQIMIAWCSLVERMNGQAEDEGREAYKKLRDQLVKNLADALAEVGTDAAASTDAQEKAGLRTICCVLEEILSCIEGRFEETDRKYFYLPFLGTDDVLLDDSYFPDFDVHSSDVELLQPEYRILQHAKKTGKDLTERLEEIFKGGDDFGSARLILQYLKETGSAIELEAYQNDLVSSEEYARETAGYRQEQFVGDLELAQSYGQIDNVNSNEDKKEKILQIVNEWYDSCLENGNLGFFQKITESYLTAIHEESKSREKDLLEQLNTFRNTQVKALTKEAKEKKIAKIERALQEQNYTVAEDLLAHADVPDEDFENLIEENFLEDFLEEYDQYYLPVAQKGSSFATLVSGRVRNKEEKGGRRLVENWLPGGSRMSRERLQTLLSGLGFSVDDKSVEEQGQIHRFQNFFVKTVAPKNGRRENYTHPIAPFGSGASREGFRVVCLNGKYDAAGLIDIMKQIGNARHTMILLDFALDKPERRSLARKCKSELGDRLFIVVDRVVMMYLVKNYDEAKVNRMLMSLVVPFGYFQPYVWESANVMPPEIFMGRRNELERIESPSGVNIVYGGRQLGKSALLKRAKDDIDHDENKDRAVFVDLKGLRYPEAAEKVGHALFDEGVLPEDITTTDWAELSRAIRKRLASDEDRIPFLLLLMDEADTFIDSCGEVNYGPLDSLKEIQNVDVGRFKFVIAGLRNIVRFKREAALGNNSVLTHLGMMTVKPFQPTEARELLEIPLHYLGLEFPKEKESLITLILANTNYFPGLIQMYCAKLLSAMRKKDYAGYDESDTPIYRVSEEHIKKVLADPEFREQIREKFTITLRLGDDDNYYLIALLMAYLYYSNGYSEGYSAEDILSTAQDLSIKGIRELSADGVSALMEELKELNVLRSTDDTHFLFARFTFFQMMGTSSEVDDRLDEFMEDEKSE